MRIDLNCDLGEGLATDAAIMPYVTSANIACGAHAGNGETMRAAVALARRFGVAVGAHPGYPDRENFGRVRLALTPEEVFATVRDQLQALGTLAAIRHVKPHGALYHEATHDGAVAAAIVHAVKQVAPAAIVIGFPGACLLGLGAAAGLRTAAEGFVDRVYGADGHLQPRTAAHSVLTGPDQVVAQALMMIEERRVRAADGSFVPVNVATLCLHGDTAGAAGIARHLHERLIKAGVELRALD